MSLWRAGGPGAAGGPLLPPPPKGWVVGRPGGREGVSVVVSALDQEVMDAEGGGASWEDGGPVPVGG